MSLGNALPTETTTAAVDSCSVLRSVNFDGNIVSLRRPLGFFSHFETSADQINAELALGTLGCTITISRRSKGHRSTKKSLGKLEVRDHYPQGAQVQTDFVEERVPGGRVVVPAVAVPPPAAVKRTLEGVQQPVPVHLGVVVRLTAAQGHVLLGEIGVHLGTVNL